MRRGFLTDKKTSNVTDGREKRGDSKYWFRRNEKELR